MKKKTRMLAGGALALALLLLPGCGRTAAASSTPAPSAETASPNAGITTLTLPAASLEELAKADDYPDLRELDLSGSSIPTAELLEWMEAHPSLNVKYSVLLGSVRVSPDAAELSAPPGVGYEELEAALQYLPALQKLRLPETALSPDQLTALSERYELEYSLRLLGQTVDAATEELDLSSLSPEQVPETAAALALLPGLRRVELMDAAGQCALGAAEVRQLVQAAPQAAFNYTFELFGKTVSTADKRIEFVRQQIGDEHEAEIRAALDLMPAGTYLLMDTCGMSDEVMASIRDDYPDKTVVWRIFCTYYFSALTDDEVILMTFDLNNENCGPLKYCTEARYIDVGHNNTLTDISWAANMPKLECIIVSGAPVSDLSPFANCPNLTWLELGFCYYVTDLTPLSGLRNLKYLNTSCSQLQDITPLMDVPLERFMCAQYPGQEIPKDQQEAFIASHPDCIAIFGAFDSNNLAVNNPYGYGWRYNDAGMTFFEYYARMRQIFHYADPNWYGGWKFDVVDLPE
ncbi:MAG: hypothetical protein IJ617_00860 [Oscillospiraceae bacterium]|nr:hypothetical protein [Oscillospiraceae bacterium]